MSVHLAESDRFVEERVKPDVLAVNVSPPDKRGWMTFGICGGMAIHKARELAKTIIVTVQKDQPRVPGEFNMIHVSDVDAIIETDMLVPHLPSAEPTELENQIASHVVPLVEDGSTIQIGIGGVPGAVALKLAEKKDLGIHTEMLTDAMFHLVKVGAVTGARKNIYRNKVVYGFAAGSGELLEFLDDNPECIIRPLSETINSHLCGLNDNFVSINTCLMVSITGQIASEAVDFVQISGTGGQLDLVRAARNSKNGKSFIVLASTRTLKSGEIISTIALGLPPGTPVTTPRTDVEYIATEYGVVNLRYKSNMERVEALISIAHPDFRDELRAGVENVVTTAPKS
jgi:4-hydroxybutyrate CoA-transferase